MPQFTIEVNVPPLADPAMIAGRKRIALAQSAELIRRAISAELTPHVVTGHTHQSFTAQVLDDSNAVVGSNDENAARLEYGTRPHVILPKNRRALAWPSSGQSAAGLGHGRQGTLIGRGEFVFAKRVNHPGTKPLLYVERAIAATEGAIVALFEMIFQ